MVRAQIRNVGHSNAEMVMRIYEPSKGGPAAPAAPGRTDFFKSRSGKFLSLLNRM